MIRAEIHVSGKSLGMSYMSVVSSAARDLKITGKVKKLPNEKIEIICECGSEADFEAFGKIISRSDSFIHVEKVDIINKKEIEKPQFTWFYVDH